MHNNWVVLVFYRFLGSLLANFAQTTGKIRGTKLQTHLEKIKVMSNIPEKRNFLFNKHPF